MLVQTSTEQEFPGVMPLQMMIIQEKPRAEICRWTFSDLAVFASL